MSRTPCGRRASPRRRRRGGANNDLAVAPRPEDEEARVDWSGGGRRGLGLRYGLDRRDEGGLRGRRSRHRGGVVARRRLPAFGRAARGPGEGRRSPRGRRRPPGPAAAGRSAPSLRSSGAEPVGSFTRTRDAPRTPYPEPLPTVTDTGGPRSALATGAEMRVTGPAGRGRRLRERRPGPRGGADVERDARVARAAARAAASPASRFGEVRYRIKSWKRLDMCIEDARAAIEQLGGERTLLLGFSMGGAVAIAAADEPRVEGVLGLAPWIPDRLDVSTLRGKRLDVLHGALDRWLPGIPGVSPRAHGAGSSVPSPPASRARTRRSRAPCTGSRCARPGDRSLPLPRAGRWAELVGAGLERFEAGSRPGGTGCCSRRAPAHLRDVGSFTSQTSPSFSRPRITHHDTSTATGPGRAAPRPGTRGGCCASPRRRRAARRASCSATRRASGSPCCPNMWQIEFTRRSRAGRGRCGSARPRRAPRRPAAQSPPTT